MAREADTQLITALMSEQFQELREELHNSLNSLETKLEAAVITVDYVRLPNSS